MIKLIDVLKELEELTEPFTDDGDTYVYAAASSNKMVQDHDIDLKVSKPMTPSQAREQIKTEPRDSLLVYFLYFKDSEVKLNTVLDTQNMDVVKDGVALYVGKATEVNRFLGHILNTDKRGNRLISRNNAPDSHVGSLTTVFWKFVSYILTYSPSLIEGSDEFIEWAKSINTSTPQFKEWALSKTFKNTNVWNYWFSNPRSEVIRYNKTLWDLINYPIESELINWKYVILYDHDKNNGQFTDFFNTLPSKTDTIKEQNIVCQYVVLSKQQAVDVATNLGLVPPAKAKDPIKWKKDQILSRLEGYFIKYIAAYNDDLRNDLEHKKITFNKEPGRFDPEDEDDNLRERKRLQQLAGIKTN